MSKENAKSKAEKVEAAKQAQSVKKAEAAEAQAVEKVEGAAETVKETAADKKLRISKEKEEAKAAKAEARETVKSEKLAAKAEAKANKPPGVIASVLEAVQTSKTPISHASVLAFLKDRFPERDENSMAKTVKAQLGGRVQPTRMEKEKSVVFEITFTQVEQTTKGKEGEADVITMVDSKEKLYFYKGVAEPSAV